mgnify:CR=1 FL=1
MGLFEEVKANVTVRQAAERYGFKPTRGGLIRCIFHNDKTPSMKVDQRYYCFGCGITGDAIDFTAQLYGLSPKDAALKLADDFGIACSSQYKNNLSAKKIISRQKSKIDVIEEQRKKYLSCVHAMLEYYGLLRDWKVQFAPKSSEEEWDERFIEALNYLSIVEYYLDILLFGDDEEKKKVTKSLGKEVENIERRCRKNGSVEKERCPKADERNGRY